MSKFQVGQKVVCVKCVNGYLRDGEIYTIKKIDDRCAIVQVTTMVHWWWCETRFELYVEQTEPVKENIVIKNKTEITKVPHVHAEFIKAWAMGETIQFFNMVEQKWDSIDVPNWLATSQYRVKPEVEYPQTLLTGEYLHHEFDSIDADLSDTLSQLANIVLKHAIDNGQVTIADNFTEKK